MSQQSPLDANLPEGQVDPITPKDILEQPNRDDVRNSLVSIGKIPLSEFDPGVFSAELLNLKIYQKHGTTDYAGGNITEGTYDGTQAALTQMYERIERAFGSYFDIQGIEPSFPRVIELASKKDMYKFSIYPYKDKDPKHGLAEALLRGFITSYPPHLDHIPKPDEVSLLKIFNVLGLAQTEIMLAKVVPDTFIGKTANFLAKIARDVVGGNPEAGPTIALVEKYNQSHRKSGTDIKRGENIGLLPDWFSDRRFADQAFSGTNPTSITRASKELVDEFIEAARTNGYEQWVGQLPKVDPKSLFVQDCSYFRKAVSVASDKIFHRTDTANVDDQSWGCASVTLFQLHDDGRLHPIAITIDYKKNMAESVTIFNKRYGPSDPTSAEKEDWPWRYAKTCAQVSDWYRHEIGVHLTDAHFIEEALIVATNRTIPMSHIIFMVLKPHWYKTLSLNAAARKTLVPQIVNEIVGFVPEETTRFMHYSYDNFNFVENYVPNQLKSRGFPSDEAGLNQPRYKNYVYAKNMTLMWEAIRKYVESMLRTHYGEEKADAMVAKDPDVANWCKEVQESAYIKSFPNVKDFNSLVDAVTMCIHIASPFHTAVNYLQNFYQGFVIAKPASLCAPPPTALKELQAYKEQDLVKALPIGEKYQRKWLLTAQIPWLLSFKVASDRSLLGFCQSQWHIYENKEDAKDVEIKNITESFYKDLCELAVKFTDNSNAMTEDSIPYIVLDPSNTATSILI